MYLCLHVCEEKVDIHTFWSVLLELSLCRVLPDIVPSVYTQIPCILVRRWNNHFSSIFFCIWSMSEHLSLIIETMDVNLNASNVWAFRKRLKYLLFWASHGKWWLDLFSISHSLICRIQDNMPFEPQGFKHTAPSCKECVLKKTVDCFGLTYLLRFSTLHFRNMLP